VAARLRAKRFYLRAMRCDGQNGGQSRLGRRRALRLASKTSNNTSLGMVPKAETTLARFVFFANASAPDDVCAITKAGRSRSSAANR
jgi:hypothetical protein